MQVRDLLLPRARTLGSDDLRILTQACKDLKDRACQDELKGH